MTLTAEQLAYVRKAVSAAVEKARQDAQTAVYAEIGRQVVHGVVYPLVTKAAAHAPAGGITINGKDYRGGEFIPADEVAKASPEEKAKLQGAEDKRQKRPGGQYGHWDGKDGEPSPATADSPRKPVSRAEQAKKREAAKSAVDAAIADPKSLTHAQLRKLRDHLTSLTKEDQVAYAKQLREKIGGTKAQLADRLRERIKAERSKKEGTRVGTEVVPTVKDETGYEAVGNERGYLSKAAALSMNASSDVAAVAKRGGRWVALRKAGENPQKAAAPDAATGDRQPAELLPADKQAEGLNKRKAEVQTWLSALEQRKPQTRYGEKSDREILELRDSLARKVNALRQSAKDGTDVSGELEKFEPRLAELNAEKEHRQEVAKAKRRHAAIEEGLRTGKLTLHEEEMRQLLGSVGDAYKDAGYRGEYNPDAMRTSDLTGRKIRRYVELPDGRIAHPDELVLAQKRGRVIVESNGPGKAAQADAPSSPAPVGSVEFESRMAQVDPRDSGAVPDVSPKVSPPDPTDDHAMSARADAGQKLQRMEGWAADRPESVAAEEAKNRAEARLRDAGGGEFGEVSDSGRTAGARPAGGKVGQEAKPVVDDIERDAEEAPPTPAPTAPKTRDQLTYLPKDPKRLTVDQADQALRDLGYANVRRVGGGTGSPDDEGVTVATGPDGREVELTHTQVKTALYGESALPVASRMSMGDLNLALKRSGRGRILGPAAFGAGGRPVSWWVKDPDGREVVLSDDEVRQAAVGAGLARSAKAPSAGKMKPKEGSANG